MEAALSCGSVTGSRARRRPFWIAVLLTLLVAAGGCGKPSTDKPEQIVLSTRSGETSIQVTESEQDGTQIIRITTTFRGEESTVVLAIDQPNYEVEIPLSIEQVRPRRAPGPGEPGERGAPGPPSGRDFQDLLMAQYLEKAQEAMLNGDYNLALRKINLVMTVRPENVKALEMKGSVYYAMGNYQLANQQWEQVLVLDPSNQEVQEFRDFLQNTQGATQPALPGTAAPTAQPPAPNAPVAPPTPQQPGGR